MTLVPAATEFRSALDGQTRNATEVVVAIVEEAEGTQRREILDLMDKCWEAASKLTRELGRVPTVEELARWLLSNPAGEGT